MVSVTLSYFLFSSSPTLRHVEMHLTDGAEIPIAEALKVNTTLISLDLRGESHVSGVIL